MNFILDTVDASCPLIWCLIGDYIDAVNAAFFHPKLMPDCSTIMFALGTSGSFMHHPANDRSWPKAVVNLRILNVGFGGVVYHGVTESEFEYNGWGGESA